MKFTFKLSYLVAVVVYSTLIWSSYARLRCPQAISQCNCTSNPHDYEYTCEPNERMSVRVRINPSDEIRIICNSDPPNDTWTVWSNLVSGINMTGKYHVMTVYNCTLPTSSFKHFLQTFGIESTKKLFLNYIPNGDSVFVDYYFNDTDTLQSLYLQYNGILALPNDIFYGLKNLERLYVDNNDLTAIDARLFQHIPRLKILELGRNYLTNLPAGIFKRVPNLLFLNVYSNSLKDLRRAVFADIPKLKSLDLNNNGLTSLNDDVFRDLSQLEDLNLNFNNISYLPEGIFANTSSLSKLRAIQSQNANVTVLPAGLFSNLTSLTSIQMNWNNFAQLPADIFVKTYNLNTLSLKRNQLVELPGTLFQDTTKLRDLDLSNNRLSSLNDTLFHKLRNLLKLNLANNRLTAINNALFASLSSLHELNLQNNDLTSLDYYAFAAMIKLKVVDLSNNKLDMKSDSILNFSYLYFCKSIEEIRLRNNSVTGIYDDWRNTDVHLKKLDLSYNKIETLDVSELQFTSSQVFVNVSHNQIRNVNLLYLETLADSRCPTTSGCDDYQAEIQLDYNPIKCDCRAYHLARYLQNIMKSSAYKWLKLIADDLRCADPQSLRDIRISKIELKSLLCPWEKVAVNGDTNGGNNSCPENCTCLYRPFDDTLIVNCTNSIYRQTIPKRVPWASYVKDIELLLSNNNLSSVDGVSKLIESFNVTKLTLSSNNLTNVDDLYIPHRLKVLELHDNRLTVLAKKIIEKLNRTISLTSITLHNNPWRCDCETKHLLNFLQARYKQIPHLNNITCYDNGKSIVTLTVDDLCGLSVAIMISCISLATFGVLFGAIIALYYRFQREIKVWMFAHKICLWLVAEKEIDRNKKYDAFVSYSHLDETFVVEQLVPQLENGDDPLRLCLHFRDWVVGDWIPDQIIKSVENSRRTIVVLSPNFLNSVWGKMEFRTAHLKAIKERCARVIVILLDDIGSTDKLDAELKTYLTTNTYVKWGDPWFWQKLKYALPHPQKYVKQHPISITKGIMNGNLRVNKLNVAPTIELMTEKERNEIKS